MSENTTKTTAKIGAGIGGAVALGIIGAAG